MRLAAVLVFALLAALPARAADEAPSAAANSAFLAANAHKPDAHVRPSGLQYRVLKSGFGHHPTLADSVQITFSARMINGKLVDSATTDLPSTLAVSNVLRGLSEGLQMMQAGDRWELVLPSDLAFGAKGSANGVVPPNQTLIFDIALLAVIPPQASQSQDAGALSVYRYDRGTSSEAGAMFTLRQ